MGSQQSLQDGAAERGPSQLLLREVPALVLCTPPPLPHIGFLKGNFLLLLEHVSALG